MAALYLAFRFLGSVLPVVHGYAQYIGTNHLGPGLHDARDMGVYPLRRGYVGDARLHPAPASGLVFRLPDDRIRSFVTLARRNLDIE